MLDAVLTMFEAVGSSYAYRWTATQRGNPANVRADLMALHVVRRMEDGDLRYWRLYGAVDHSDGYGVLLFSPGNVRVTGGYRVGALLRPSSVKARERVTQAGVSKVLRYDNDQICMRNDSKLDADMLKGILESCISPEVAARVDAPPVFMTFRPSESDDHVTCKLTDQATALLVSRDDYDENATLADNAFRLSPEFRTAVGDRIGYPYCMYEGRGVLSFVPDEHYTEGWRLTKSLSTTNEAEVRITL